MSKITPLMTSLHIWHKAEERIKCIDNMLFKKCEDTKDTILQAFWWYRKNSISLEKVKRAREELSNRVYDYSGSGEEITQAYCDGFKDSLKILDKLISESEEYNDNK